MSQLRISREEESVGEVALHLEGILDHLAVHDLERALERVIAKDTLSKNIILDFSHVRHFDDAAIPAFLRATDNKACRFRGLLRHQLRMFRYFGHTTGLTEERAAG